MNETKFHASKLLSASHIAFEGKMHQSQC